MKNNKTFSNKQSLYLFLKRILDILFSIVLIPTCFLLIWWWVFIINLFVTKWRPFYCPLRYGKNKRVFHILKFRTMPIGTVEIPPFCLTDDQQKSMCTWFGKFLRSSSIDETPQFINVLLGQMSFIGPRPCSLKNEEDLINYRYSYIPNPFLLKPGITGYAQVKMNRGHNPKDKAYFDYFYTSNISLKIDIKIVCFTLIRLLGLMKGK